MDFGYQNPMLVTVVDTLSLLFSPVCLNVVFLSLPRSFTATLFRSHRHKLCIAHFRAKHEKLAHAVVPPLPKKSADFSGALAVIVQSYPIRIII